MLLKGSGGHGAKAPLGIQQSWRLRPWAVGMLLKDVLSTLLFTNPLDYKIPCKTNPSPHAPTLDNFNFGRSVPEAGVPSSARFCRKALCF